MIDERQGDDGGGRHDQRPFGLVARLEALEGDREGIELRVPEVDQRPKKSPHFSMNVKSATVMSAGHDSGRMIRHRIRSSLAPSIRAASTARRRDHRKNWRSRKMKNGLPRNVGMSRGRKSRSSRARLKVTYSGMNVTWVGSIIVASRIRKTMSRPGQRIRAKP